ncbi:MAG TPA: anaerobic glycerol-3-phosphate dehydrogenase subunit GlpB [Candidatus Dormibacteraeota bacterium]
MKTDVAVIGSGLAALAAARTVQQSGRRVVLVWPGLSSLYFVFATVDVLGYPTATAADPIDDPAKGLAQLIAKQPGHPYARAGMKAVEDGTSLMLEWFKDAGLAWEGSLNRNFLLPTATGAPKPSCLAPASMTAGDLRRPEPIVLCGFVGYQDFAPELAASNLKQQWKAGEVSAVRVTAPGYGPDRLFTSIDLARSFEDATFRDAVAGQLRDKLIGDGARVGMPGVLGLTTPNETFAAFQRSVGHPVFEIPTIPPSVIALRLFDRLRKHLQEGGIEIIWAAPAHAADVTDGRCRSILLKAAGHELPVEAASYVLALEDWVDGALRAGVHTVRDPFFHQPVAWHKVPTDRAAESLFASQPFEQIGYALTDRLQPADENGKPLARNVFIAGGAMAGYDPSGTKSRGGMAIATGYRAAKEALAA